jgi:sialic acid synthase SpsE
MMCSRDREENIKKAEELIREAAGKGADIIQVQCKCQHKNVKKFRNENVVF